MALAITAPADGAFLGSNGPFEVRGTKAAGSSVAVSGSVTCSVAADPATEWACKVSGLPNGAGAQITATQTQNQPLESPDSANDETVAASPASSAEVTITVDVLGAPVLSGPAAFVTSGTVSGSAVPGAGVVASVAGSAEPACVSKALDNGYWSCSLALPSGTYRVAAQQSKIGIGQPGDLSDASAAKTVTVDKIAPDAPQSSPRPGLGRVSRRSRPPMPAPGRPTAGWMPMSTGASCVPPRSSRGLELFGGWRPARHPLRPGDPA